MRWLDDSSLTQWAWVWANSGRQWKTRKPGTLMFMRSQRVRHNLVNEQQSISSFIYNGITWLGEGTGLTANFPALRRKSLPKKKNNDVDKMTLSVVWIRKLVYQKVFVWFHLYKVPRIVKFIELECTLGGTSADEELVFNVDRVSV